MNAVILKRGKEMPIVNHHHWIFSGAIQSAPKYQNGDILPVEDSEGEMMGYAMMNKDTVIAGRMVNFSNEDPLKSIKHNIINAFEFRKKFFSEETNCYRVINGEGDGLSGLIVDKYNDVLVIQIVSTGFDKIKDFLIKTFVEVASPVCIYEKSTIHARTKDGLDYFEGVIYGNLPKKVVVKENGIKFEVDIKNSQKTGLFLDQREMRKLVGELSYGKSVLNCFSYTGGFSLYAVQGGATEVTSVDISADAVENSKQNFLLNGFNLENHKFMAEDAFRFLHDDPLQYDFIILDPPAFAKKKSDVPNAKRGYLDINRTTLRKMPKNSFLLTCSCSYHMDQTQFEWIISQAALDSNRKVRIIGKHRLAADHPINIFHSEIDYLKSLLLYIG